MSLQSGRLGRCVGTLSLGLISLSGITACQTTKALTSQEANLSSSDRVATHGEIQTVASDGVTVYGDYHADGLTEDDPLILLFHQGGSNVRGEYGPIIPWLNDNGFRIMAWDLRSGGEIYGDRNRTKEGLPDTQTTPSYCDAYPDMEAALDYAITRLDTKPIIWGSSYSGALVFKLARDYPNMVAGLIAFSPASGGPMVDCKAALYVETVPVPMKAFSPSSEMERESVQDQHDILTQNGVTYSVIPDGIHGSSMLVDDRTETDMSAARALVLYWLQDQTD